MGRVFGGGGGGRGGRVVCLGGGGGGEGGGDVIRCNVPQQIQSVLHTLNTWGSLGGIWAGRGLVLTTDLKIRSVVLTGRRPRKVVSLTDSVIEWRF